MGCDISQKGLSFATVGFNPRTRVGCDDLVLVDVEQFHFVSIHAPAWGATTRALGCRPTENRFQSTHPRGVRLAHRFDGRKDPLVSIHAPAWGATRMWNRRVKEDYVSIHAPAWGATIIRQSNKRGEGMFQSTHPRGVRPYVRVTNEAKGWFQSTHPRGVRRSYC